MNFDTAVRRNVEISILKYCFIVELFEKWRSGVPPSPSRASHSGDTFGRFGDSTWRFSTCERAKSRCHTGGGGGGRLGNPTGGLFPKKKELFFFVFNLS